MSLSASDRELLLQTFLTEAAEHLHTMEEQTYRANVRERTSFEVAHRAETDHLRNLVEAFVDRDFSLQNQQREKQRHQELLNNRQIEHKEVIDATEAARGRHKTILDAQRDEEQRIFQSQQLFHRTKLENEKLEQDIRALEKLGGEGKKP